MFPFLFQLTLFDSLNSPNKPSYFLIGWKFRQLFFSSKIFIILFINFLFYVGVQLTKYTCNAGDPGSIRRLGRSTGEGIGYSLQYSWAFLVAQLVKNLTAMQETCIRFQEKKKATHSSILAWRIRGLYRPWGHKELDMTEQLSVSLPTSNLVIISPSQPINNLVIVSGKQ